MTPGIVAIRFDENSYFKIIPRFTPQWDYKHYKEHVGRKIIKVITLDNFYIRCDCDDGSVINGIRQPKLLRFLILQPPGFRVFCETETIHIKK